MKATAALGRGAVAVWLGLGASLLGCGGGAPLMHGAHVLAPDQMAVGAGFSSEFRFTPTKTEADPLAERMLDESVLSPGLAPWVSARLGFENDFEAGLTYTGRTVRLDLRHAFALGEPTALSLGLGASGVLPKRRDDIGIRVGGGGADLPILLGWRSSADILALWIGARGGFEVVEGEHQLAVAVDASTAAAVTEKVTGWHEYVGGLAGVRVGFRYLFAVLEVDAAMNWTNGDVGTESATLRAFGLAPAGAIVGRF